MDNTLFNTVDYCDLPSRGELYPEGDPLHGADKIAFRDMTLKEEDILANKTLVKNGVAFDRVLQNVLEDQRINVSNMTISDKQALLLRLRINSYGPEYKISMKCPECGTRQDVVIDLQESFDKAMGFVKPLEETLEFYKKYDLKRLGHDTFSFITKKSKSEIVFRIGRGADEHTMFRMEEKRQRGRNKKDANLEVLDGGAVLETFKMFIVSINGVSNPLELSALLAHLHSMDTWHIREIYREVSCQMTLLSDFVCVNEEQCGYEHEIEVPLTANFFRHSDD